MSVSYLDVEDIGRVKIYRRRGLKNIRVSINGGEVRLSIPWYVPKKAGLRFLHSQKDWIYKHKKSKKEYSDGLLITKDHTLRLYDHESVRVKSVVEKNLIHIYVPTQYTPEKKQRVVAAHIDKFLLTESEKVLVPLINKLADTSGYRFSGLQIRKMKSRWGSCNHKKKITLNSSLLTLPDDLVEYVMVHELVHTRHLNHSKMFWQEVEILLPDYKHRRKALKSYDSAGIL